MLLMGNQLKAARALAGLSQIQLVKAANVNVTTISAMERKGAKSLTSGIDTAHKITLALEAAGVELMGGGPAWSPADGWERRLAPGPRRNSTRSKFQNSSILNALIEHVEGQREMSASSTIGEGSWPR
jgi:transcriptional regulator with XRE-family HTH domain